MRRSPPSSMSYSTVPAPAARPSSIGRYSGGRLISQTEMGDQRWATLHSPTGQMIAFQDVARYVASRWPDPV
jgi:hypothetical protein